MPDHIHVLLSPPEEITLERAAGLIKGGISFRLREQIRHTLWEEGYHDVRMRSREQTMAAANYIRDNPAKAGLKDWPFVIFRPETI
jgi:putative transposase